MKTIVIILAPTVFNSATAQTKSQPLIFTIYGGVDQIALYDYRGRPDNPDIVDSNGRFARKIHKKVVLDEKEAKELASKLTDNRKFRGYFMV